MNRKQLKIVALAAICVAAIAFAAATVDSSVERGPGSDLRSDFFAQDPGSDSGDTTPGRGDEGDGMVDRQDRGNDILGSPGAPLALCVDLLKDPSVLAAGVFGLLLLGFVMKRRANAIVAMALVPSLAFPGLIAYLLLTSGCDTSASMASKASVIPGNVSSAAGGPGGAGQGGGGAGQTTTVTSPSFLVFALVLVVGVVFAFRYLRSGGEDEDEPIEEPSVEVEDRVEAIGAVAGRAADRIEDAPSEVENEVYRAWAEMTRQLDVDHPESSTPAEFAAAAVDAGLAREDVDELTRLFEEVRYGGKDPTEDREQRAVAALRNIEAEYGEGSA